MFPQLDASGGKKQDWGRGARAVCRAPEGHAEGGCKEEDHSQESPHSSIHHKRLPEVSVCVLDVGSVGGALLISDDLSLDHCVSGTAI